MPIRPALASIHPRRPQPRDVRSVQCPHCARRFEVSRRAISLRCPQCTRPLRFEDVTIRHRMKGELATMGHVSLDAPSEMIGRLTCGQFTSGGRFEGTLTTFGPIRLDAHSVTSGVLVGKSLHVTLGATLRAKAVIGPRPRPPQPAVVVKKPPRPQYAI